MELSRQYVKLCDRRDFDDQRVLAAIGDIVPDLEGVALLERKYWEYAMLALFLEEVGTLHDGARVLAVGAGHEAVLYWLANRVGRVVATDIYGAGDFASGEADASMLEDPASFAPYPYRKDRLEAREMDARHLEFGDDTFDAVFSLSSIEHFGNAKDIARSSAEMGRVLRPGGHAFVVTECFVRTHPLDSPLLQTAVRLATFGRRARGATPRERAVDVFTPRELHSRIVRPSGLQLVQPLDVQLSPETFESVSRWSASGELTRVRPHILLQGQGAPWTSVCLALESRSG